MQDPSPGRRTLSMANSAARAADDAVRRLEGFEFDLFRCGSRVPRWLSEHPRHEQDEYRKDAQRELRFALEARWPNRRFEAECPEVLIDADPDGGGTRVVSMPLLIAGRYQKLARGLSQTVFHCRVCRGKRNRGRETCEACGSSGRFVAESVEGFVRLALKRALFVDGDPRPPHLAFHGSGREDVDVRMLGTGRPFVISVEMPRRRHADFAAVARDVETSSAGRVLVTDLRVVTRDQSRQITGDHGEKTYVAVIAPTTAVDLPEDAAARMIALSGATLLQRTPQRVGARRADLVRERVVHEVVVTESSPRRVVVRLRTEPGTYVKEFISGDDGRTEPSIASALGVPCVCVELDVVGVGDAG